MIPQTLINSTFRATTDSNGAQVITSIVMPKGYFDDLFVKGKLQVKGNIEVVPTDGAQSIINGFQTTSDYITPIINGNPSVQFNRYGIDMQGKSIVGFATASTAAIFNTQGTLEAAEFLDSQSGVLTYAAGNPPVIKWRRPQLPCWSTLISGTSTITLAANTYKSIDINSVSNTAIFSTHSGDPNFAFSQSYFDALTVKGRIKYIGTSSMLFAISAHAVLQPTAAGTFSIRIYVNDASAGANQSIYLAASPAKPLTTLSPEIMLLNPNDVVSVAISGTANATVSVQALTLTVAATQVPTF